MYENSFPNKRFKHTIEFLKKHVIEITQNRDKTIDFKLRSQDFIVHLGSVELMDKKINNLKAFYKKVMVADGWEKYKSIDMSFDGQIVCQKVKTDS